MPVYEYEFGYGQQKYEISIYHSITKAPMKKVSDILQEMQSSPDCAKVVAGDDTSEAGTCLEFMQANPDLPLSSLVTSVPGIAFKGNGWPSKDFKKGSINTYFSGKQRENVKRIQESNRNRINKGVSADEVRKDLKLSIGDGSIVKEKEWKKLSNGEKKIATDNGLRPSAAYLK